MAKRRYDAAVMHDFFVDRLVHTRDLPRLFELAWRKWKRGGGSIHDIAEEDVSGGNAVNLAHALGTLGAKVLIVTHSDEEHRPQLQKAFRGLKVEARVKPLPAGLTVSFEERVNVMVSYSGGAAKFSPALLTEGDWRALRSSRIVCSANWAANDQGTELLVALRENLGERATVHLGTADVTDREARYRKLVDLMKRKRLADWLSVNEFEAGATARALGLSPGTTKKMCGMISRELGIMVDLHTEYSSYTSTDGSVVERKTHHVRPRRLTGAGDVWDAASIFANLRGMDDGDRLEFANTAARLYVQAEPLRPPTLKEVRDALG
ncbi:MAG: carbohydrate kinase family protein [Nitrososphaerales archaeon]|nr:carbohydrate kinase family protein [Nitrososphaerales archaeon]